MLSAFSPRQPASHAALLKHDDGLQAWSLSLARPRDAEVTSCAQHWPSPAAACWLGPIGKCCTPEPCPHLDCPGATRARAVPRAHAPCPSPALGPYLRVTT